MRRTVPSLRCRRRQTFSMPFTQELGASDTPRTAFPVSATAVPNAGKFFESGRERQKIPCSKVIDGQTPQNRDACIRDSARIVPGVTLSLDYRRVLERNFSGWKAALPPLRSHAGRPHSAAIELDVFWLCDQLSLASPRFLGTISRKKRSWFSGVCGGEVVASCPVLVG
jgi:hypothetical protein